MSETQTLKQATDDEKDYASLLEKAEARIKHLEEKLEYLQKFVDN